MRTPKNLAAMLLACSLAAVAYPQTPTAATAAPSIPQACNAVAARIQQATGADAKARASGDNTTNLRAAAIRDAVRITSFPDCFSDLLRSSTGTATSVATLGKIATQSTNRSIGAPSNTAGTTSAVAQPFSLLSLASEYGGITTSSSNGTFTIQSALDQIPSTLIQNQILVGCTSFVESKCVTNGTLDFLHRFSIGATFNTSTPSQNVSATPAGSAHGTAQPISATATGSSVPSFSAATMKITLFGTRADTAKAWAEALSTSSEVTTAANSLLSAAASADKLGLDQNFYYLKWQTCTGRALENASNSDQLNRTIATYYTQLSAILIKGSPFVCYQNGPDDQALEAMIENQNGVKKPAKPTPLQGAEEDLANEASLMASYSRAITNLVRQTTMPVLAFEYDYLKPLDQPTNSTLRLIFSKSFVKKQQDNFLTITANVASSLYNTLPSANIPGSGRIRDVQAGAEIDMLLPTLRLLGQSTLGAAYYFQDQTSPAILNVTPGSPLPGVTFTGLPSSATQVFAQKGDIHVAQLKWGLGAGKSVKFPIAFSYASRTELVPRPDWRGEFGISWDLTAFSMGSGTSGTK